MKKLIVTAILATSFLFITACTDKDTKDTKENNEIVAAFDNGTITKDEFYEEMKTQVGEAILHNLLLEKILTDKYEPTDEQLNEVDEKIKADKEQLGDSFETALLSSGFRDEEDYKSALTIEKLLEQARQEALDKMEIPDEDIQAEFEKRKEKVKVSHILVTDEEKAKDIKKQLDDGADFAELATKYSEDPGSQMTGGDIGFIGPEDNFVESFKTAAFNMKVGEVSNPVKSNYGWHIIKVTDDNSDLELDSVREEITNTLKDQQFDTEAFINNLIKEANVDIKIEEFKDMYKETETDTEEK